MTTALPHPRTIVGAVAAGVIAAVTSLACFAGLNVALLGTPGFTLAGLFRFDASALLGPVAYTNDAYVALGAGVHFVVAIGWAIGYAFAAQRQTQLLLRPLISGAGFGFIVYFAMQLVLVAANLYRVPTPAELGVALLAHLPCFGVPVALIVARTPRSK